MKKCILVLIFCTLLFSCTKESTYIAPARLTTTVTSPYLTQGQLTALRMQKDFGIEPDGVIYFDRIMLYDNGALKGNGGGSVKVTSDGYLVIGYNGSTGPATYNLSLLKYYASDNYIGVYGLPKTELSLTF